MVPVKCALDDPEGQHAQQALGVHATLILLQPDAALELVGLLNEERGRTSMQAYFIVDRNILSIHRYYSLSKKSFGLYRIIYHRGPIRQCHFARNGADLAINTDKASPRAGIYFNSTTVTPDSPSP